MAIQEADREDLFSELQQHVPRWELSTADGTLVCGLRSDGRFSLYFSQDRCFHFDSSNRLLRGFVDGLLFRTQGNTLSRLVRDRSESKSQLLRTDLSPAERDQFFSELRSAVANLRNVLLAGEFTLLRRVPETGDLAPLQLRLDLLAAEPIRLAPAYPGRR